MEITIVRTFDTMSDKKVRKKRIEHRKQLFCLLKAAKDCNKEADLLEKDEAAIEDKDGNPKAYYLLSNSERLARLTFCNSPDDGDFERLKTKEQAKITKEIDRLRGEAEDYDDRAEYILEGLKFGNRYRNAKAEILKKEIKLRDKNNPSLTLKAFLAQKNNTRA